MPRSVGRFPCKTYGDPCTADNWPVVSAPDRAGSGSVARGCMFLVCQNLTYTEPTGSGIGARDRQLSSQRIYARFFCGQNQLQRCRPGVAFFAYNQQLILWIKSQVIHRHLSTIAGRGPWFRIPCQSRLNRKNRQIERDPAAADGRSIKCRQGPCFSQIFTTKMI